MSTFRHAESREATTATVSPEAFAKLRRDFSVYDVYQDYRRYAERHSIHTAREYFSDTLQAQIASHFKEKVAHEITPYFLLEIGPLADQSADDGIYLTDRLYPQDERVSTRAMRGLQAAHHPHPSPAEQALEQRYQLEYHQTVLLEDHFRQLHEQLSAQWGDDPRRLHSQITLPDGSSTRGWQGEWSAILLPTSPVHGNIGSIIYVYRPVAVALGDGIQYLVKTQGLFHQASLEKQHQTLVDPAQAAEITATESDLMSLLVKLPTELRSLELNALLYELGHRVGISDLLTRHAQQQAQDQHLTTSIKHISDTLLTIFEQELTAAHNSAHSTPTDNSLATRLQTAFEPLMHQLLLKQHVSVQLVNDVQSNYRNLRQGQTRDGFITQLALSTPSLLTRVAGFSLCGFSSYGGLSAQAMSVQPGGILAPFRLAKDRCKPKQCPRCGTLIISNISLCPSCGLHKKEVGHFLSKASQLQESTPTLSDTQKPRTKHATLSNFSRPTVSVMDVINGKDRLLAQLN